jgi:hypothetical protein
MSKLGQLRKKWNYLQSAHRCINCAHYRKANTFLRNSLPVQTPAMCTSGDFITRPNAVCNMWIGTPS